MFRQLLRRVACALLVVFGALLVASPPAADANTGTSNAKARAKALAFIKAKFASHLKYANGPTGLGAAYKSYCMEMDQISKQLAAGTIKPAEAALSFAGSWEGFLDACDDVVLTVWNTAAGNVLETLGADSSLDASDSALGLLPGQGGAWDALEAGLQKALDKVRAKALAKLKKMQKAASKAGCINAKTGGPYVDGTSHAQANPGGTAAPKSPATPKQKEFKMDTEASGSTIDQPSSGIICVSGQADPGNSNKVTVTLYDKSGNAVGAPQTVNINNKCRWRACFPPSAPFNLPSGQYRIEATQTTGGSSTAVNFTVPSTN